MQTKLIISLLTGGIVSLATLYLAFRNVPMADLVAYLGEISYIWIVPAAVMVVLTFVLRTYRWRVILSGSARLGFWQAFHPLMIGFMMNCVLPGRVGELARPAILKKRNNIPLSTGLATVAAERIFDLIMMIALFAAVFSTVTERPDPNITFAGIHLNSQMLQSAAWAMIRLSIILLIGVALVAMPLTRQWIIRTIEVVFALIGRIVPGLGRVTERLAIFSAGLVNGFSEGFNLVSRPQRLLACSGLTIAIWSLTILIYVVLAKGCPGIDLTWEQLTTMMVVVCFFIALPSAPGFWGLWEAGGVFALALFGVTEKDAAGYTLAGHAVQMFPVILIGLASAMATGVNFWQLTYGDKTDTTQRLMEKGSTAGDPS